MSSGLGKGIGIPVKLLHEAEGHTVTVSERSRAHFRVIAWFGTGWVNVDGAYGAEARISRVLRAFFRGGMKLSLIHI